MGTDVRQSQMCCCIFSLYILPIDGGWICLRAWHLFGVRGLGMWHFDIIHVPHYLRRV